MTKKMAGKGICRALVLALLLIALMTGAACADQVGSMQALMNRIAANDNNIVLTDDIVVTQTLNIDAGKNIRIDLNGNQITRADDVGTLFSVSGGRLTIADSRMASAAETKVSAPSRDGDASDGTGIALPSTLHSGVLTYYESRSAVNADGISTTETRFENKVNVNNMGRVLSGNSSNTALFQVSGSNAALTIQGGAFSNPNGRIIEANSGATLNLTGGYFYNSTAGGATGGAVYINGYSGKVTANIGGAAGSEAVFVGNSGANGGALATDGESELNIHDGAVFTGNKATGQGRNGGGAIFVGYNSNATMDGGLITNNWGTADIVGTASSSSYEAGGGGMLVRGTLLMTDGQITHNEAAGGGGLGTVFWDGGVLTIRGGIIAGNVARINEGGGITVNMNGSATIVGTAEKATYITNNATETTHHWGGGGLFAADYSTVRMLSLVITDNEAGGFGGGLAGCSTGRIDTHALNIADHSIGLYGNRAEGTQLSGDESTKSEDRVYAAKDPVFMREGDYYQDYFCALNTTVCTGMLGGGQAMWTGTVDGRPITPADVGVNERITSQYITGLTGNPSSTDIGKALAKGLVFVTGNSSGTHGGGILCNGYLIVGTQNEIEIGDRMTIIGDKTVSGGSVNDAFTFIVTDANGRQITTGTSQGDSEITFAGRIPFDDEGTYTFWIYESDENMPAGITPDATRYRMVVTVASTSQNTSVPSATDPTQMETIHVIFNKISSVEVYKHRDASDASGTRVAHHTNISSENRNAYDLPYTFEFVNNVTKDTGFVVSKTVHDLSGKSGDVAFSFSVTLNDSTISGKYGDMTFADGVANFTLKAGQSAQAIGLPANVRYTVTETPASGYYIANASRTGTTVQDVVQSVVFENTAVGSLKITKTVAGSGATSFDRARSFAFTITLTNDRSINGPYGNVVFQNGVAHVELKHGQEITIPNLPAGTTYEVKEETTDGFDQNETTHNGVIAIGQTSTADYVNTRKTGELHVKKSVIDSDYDGETFEFTIELINAAHINGTYGDMTFENGKATVFLGHGQTAKATGLPTGLGYRVDEKHSDGYAVSVVGNSSGVIGDAPAIVEYTNEKFAGLQIRKDVSGTLMDRAKAFTFELTLINEQYPLADTYGGLTFENGKATFTLKDGDNLVITGLPDGTTYTVRELNVDADLYDVQINGTRSETYTATGELSSGDSAAVGFHNLRRVGKLELTKTVSSPVAGDSERAFEFTVTLSEPINARLGDFQFVGGVVQVFLKAGQTMTADNLPAGITYTIVETADPDFDSSVVSGKASDTIVADQTSSVTFHNARRLGNLRIRKVVEDDAAAQTDKFGFKITLDRELNGTFGDVAFANGVGTFELTNGATVTITGLPEHTVYTIIETTFDALKYVPVTNTIQGNIDYNDTMEVEFVNEVLGSLVVAKTVEGVGADRTKAFSFTVTLSDTAINGTFGDMTFANGVATFTLKHGERAVATRLPDDISYTVEEAADPAYRTSVPANAEGLITAHQVQHVGFVNTFITGGLEVEKTIEGDGANPADEFTFTVTLGDNTINGKYGDMTFANGVASVVLKGGEKATAANLPAGVAYKVEEAASTYIATVPTNAQGTIAADTTVNVKFVNTKKIERGNLVVRKMIVGNGADMAEKFGFTVTLSDTTINGTFGDMTFTNGVAAFQLGHEGSVMAAGLPVGITYTVVEDSKDYTAASTGETGSIVMNTTVKAEFINTKEIGNLIVRKTIAGNDADMAEKFDFTVTLSDTTINGTFGDMTFTNGVAAFQLGHEGSAMAAGLPVGITYTVAEDSKDYTATSTGETGSIVMSTIAKAEFINTKARECGDLTVSKTITGKGADMNAKFTFRVTLADQSVTGTFGDMTFANGVATFQLGHAETAAAKQLPAGVAYKVEELDSADYEVTAANADGVVAGNQATLVTFVNNREKIELPQTGDQSSLMLYVAMLAMSVGLLVIRKRKTE